VAVLREVAQNPDQIYCCYLQGGGFRNKGFLKTLTTGWARTLLHSTAHGIEKIEEGHFLEGDLYDFGRSHAMEKTIAPEFYKTEQHYTGWYPDIGSDYVGNGIGVTDRATTKQGEFWFIAGFPNRGSDYENPSKINEYSIKSF
jgi:hypothetical protein